MLAQDFLIVTHAIQTSIPAQIFTKIEPTKAHF